MHLAGADVRLTCDASGGVTARTDAGVLPVATANGLVLVWFAPGGEPPTFEIPALDTHGWSQPLFSSVTVATSPETVMMDLADTVHFTTIHGYRQVTPAEPLTHDGAQLRVAFTMLRRLWGDRLGLDQQVLFRCWAWGMGYQVAQVEYA